MGMQMLGSAALFGEGFGAGGGGLVAEGYASSGLAEEADGRGSDAAGASGDEGGAAGEGQGDAGVGGVWHGFDAI